MKFDLKNNLPKNSQQGGYITVIVVIIIALLVMRYYGITFSGIFYFVRDLFYGVL